jgi:hypothetical protein
MPEGCISIKRWECTSALGLGLALRLGAGNSALPYIGQAGSDGRDCHRLHSAICISGRSQLSISRGRGRFGHCQR